MTLTAGKVKNSAAIILLITSLLQLIPLFLSNSYTTNNHRSFGSLNRFEQTIILFPLLIDLILITYVLLVIMNFFNLSTSKIIFLTIFFVVSLAIRLTSLNMLANMFFSSRISLDGYQYGFVWITILVALIFIPIFVFLDTVTSIILYPMGISLQRRIIFHVLAVISLFFSIFSGFTFIFPIFASLLFYSVKFATGFGNHRNMVNDQV